MLDDIYLEYLIKRKPSGKQRAAIAAVCLGAASLSVILLYLMFTLGYVLAGTGYGSFVFSIGLVMIAFAWYGAYLIINMQRLEFEYILTNSALDIDKVLAKKGRRPFLSLDFKQVIICASTEDDENNADYLNVVPSKVYDAVGDKSKGGIYFIDFEQDSQRVRLLFQPPHKLISSAKRYNIRKIFVKD